MKKFRAKNNLHGKKRLVVQISHIHITHTSVRLLLSTTTIVIGGTLQKVGRSVDKTVFCVKSNNFFFRETDLRNCWMRFVNSHHVCLSAKNYFELENADLYWHTYILKDHIHLQHFSKKNFFLRQFFCFSAKFP